jgi:acyl-coenzyme A thioesterase PaaI-like protein
MVLKGLVQGAAIIVLHLILQSPTMHPTKPNQISRTVARFQALPPGLRTWALSFVLGKVVPMVGTAGLRFEEVSAERVVVSIRNKPKVRNHIKGLHAAAMALLAETATGFCVGMHLPDDKLPLMKTMKINYTKRAQGNMKAVAQLRPEQIKQILTEEKGEVLVPVRITDDSGESPIECEMLWAWVPKKRG